MKTEFGKTRSGQQVFLYTLENKNQMKVSVMNLGATIVSMEVPDKNGKIRDVVLGYDNAETYQENTYYFGAVIGRNSNRIKDAACTIDGVRYQLEANDSENNLHSGSQGFHDVLWEAEDEENQPEKISFRYFSKDGEQGFPGNLTVKITYTLTEENEFIISYEGSTDKTTVFNVTNHTYYNLSGHDSGNIEEHELEIAAASYTPVVDEKAIPTGEIAEVAGTPMDFTKAKTIGQDIGADFEQLHFAGGFDHNYALDKIDGTPRPAARARAKDSGICMDVYTDCVGIQFYSGNFIKDHKGKDGVTYGYRQGFCLETQYFPNAVNEERFLSPLLESGKVFRTQTKMKFYLCG